MNTTAPTAPHYDLIIIGGGIVGLATACQLSDRFRQRSLRILLIEKEPELAFHQTGHNSGVIHSGVYYKPQSLKAIICQKGRKALVSFAQKHHIPHDICGKLIVATQESELPQLEEIHRRAIANEVEDVEWLSAARITDYEPYCAGIKALRVGCAGIINYRTVAQKYAELFRAQGGDILLKCELLDIEEENDSTRLITNQGILHTRYLIACGGSQCDRIARKHHLEPNLRIVGFRGEYYELLNKERVRNLIYPVPNPNFPWLGVHFTRMIEGDIECGPNAVFAFKRDGYRKSDFDWQDTKDALTYSGFWKLVSKHLGYGIQEQYRSLSKRAFYKSLLPLIPSLKMDEIVSGRAGVRALALSPDGTMIDDFKFVHNRNAIHVLNAPSPAATASLAIGDYVAAMAQERFSW